MLCRRLIMRGECGILVVTQLYVNSNYRALIETSISMDLHRQRIER